MDLLGATLERTRLHCITAYLDYVWRTEQIVKHRNVGLRKKHAIFIGILLLKSVHFFVLSVGNFTYYERVIQYDAVSFILSKVVINKVAWASTIMMAFINYAFYFYDNQSNNLLLKGVLLQDKHPFFLSLHMLNGKLICTKIRNSFIMTRSLFQVLNMTGGIY